MLFGSDPTFRSWGPFINHETYIIQPVNPADLATAIVAFVIITGFAASAAYAGYKQTTRSREPWKSAYIWMVWMEWTACVILAVLCLMFLLRVVRPSFYFFMVVLLLWVVQTQCLLQIIINRIRIILHNRKRGRQLMIGTFIIMSLINVSVFSIWIPARLQMSANWMHINEIYDRIEKVLYLMIDAVLNVYFIRTVRANLVSNGLQKYNKLVRFNCFMIVISLLMDLVILGTMSLPNGFVYAMFHPLSYLVKLNIEMSMARLIKKIALGSNNAATAAAFRSFEDSSHPHKSLSSNGGFKTWAAQQGASLKKVLNGDEAKSGNDAGIKKTEEFTVHSAPATELEMQPHKHSGEKGVHVGITSIITPEERNDFKDTKAHRAKQIMSDEENLIKPQPALLPSRRSIDSSGTPSEASDMR